MSIRAEIQADIHGEPIPNLMCDYCTGGDDEFVGTENVLLEVLKVENLPRFEKIADPPNGWVYDAVRCDDHQTDSLALPSDGYAEALVVVDFIEGQRPEEPPVIDASEMVLLDQYGASEGADPPPLPLRLMEKALRKRRDYGFFRIARLEPVLPSYKQRLPSIAEMVEASIERARQHE